MNHGRTIRAHEKGRFIDRIMTNCHDQTGFDSVFQRHHRFQFVASGEVIQLLEIFWM
jgi:hypothetical protein